MKFVTRCIVEDGSNQRRGHIFDIHSFIYLLRTIDKHDIKQITSRTARLTAALTTALNVT